MSEPESFNDKIIAEFRANDGKVGGMFEGAPLLLLTTTGAKTGQRRIAPLAYTTDGDKLVIIASKAGAPNNPDWYHNIAADPNVIVEVGTETYAATSQIVTGEERDRLFNQMAAQMPGFAEYQRNTERIIPVVTLTRAV